MSEYQRKLRDALGDSHVAAFAPNGVPQPLGALMCCAMWAIAADTALLLRNVEAESDAQELNQLSSELMTYLVGLATEIGSTDLRDIKAKALLAAALMSRSSGEEALDVLGSAIRDLERMIVASAQPLPPA